MAKSLASLQSTGPATACGFHFLKKLPLYDAEKPYYFSGALEENDEEMRTNLDYEIHEGLQVRDIRGFENLLALHEHGFELIRHPPVVSLIDPTEADINKYLDDLTSVVKQRLGAEVVLAYSYRFRREESKQDNVNSNTPKGTYTNQDKPVLVPHTDQTSENGLNRVRRHLSDEEAERYLNGHHRIRIINTWRPLNHSTDERPLAMCDFTTVDRGDLRSADRASREYVGEIYYLHYNPNQKWYWISGQSPEEMLLFTNFDSSPHDGVPFMVHSAFQNLDFAGKMERRESLETALIVISPLQDSES